MSHLDAFPTVSLAAALPVLLCKCQLNDTVLVCKTPFERVSLSFCKGFVKEGLRQEQKLRQTVAHEYPLYSAASARLFKVFENKQQDLLLATAGLAYDQWRGLS